MDPIALPDLCGRWASLAFTLGGPEIAIVAGIILLLFGAGRVPGLMKSLARGAATVKHEHDELMAEVNSVKGALTREVSDITKGVSADVSGDDADAEQA